MEKAVETAIVVDLSPASHTALQALVTNLLREPNLDAGPILQEVLTALEHPRMAVMEAEDAARAMAGALLDLIAAFEPALGAEGPVVLNAEAADALRQELAQAEEVLDGWELPVRRAAREEE